MTQMPIVVGLILRLDRHRNSDGYRLVRFAVRAASKGTISWEDIMFSPLGRIQAVIVVKELVGYSKGLLSHVLSASLALSVVTRCRDAVESKLFMQPSACFT